MRNRPLAPLLTTLSLAAGLLLAGCRTTRFVPDNEYLLNSAQVRCDVRSVPRDELESLIQQRANKKLLWSLRLHLHAYNLLCNENDRGLLNRIGKTVGERPVIYDRFLTEKTITQLERHMANRGYYDAQVRDSLVYGDRRVDLYYVISGREPYVVSSHRYELSEAARRAAAPDTAATAIRPGATFDVELFEQERQRITRQMKERGYYYFAPSEVSFVADTTAGGRQVAVTTRMGTPGAEAAYKPCYVRAVHIYPSFDPKRAIIEGEAYTQSFDTATARGYKIFTGTGIEIDPKVVLKALSIAEGDRYDIRAVESTHRFLNSLQFFKLINIRFDSPQPLGDTALAVNCVMQLTPYTIQGYNIELEGNNSGNNYEAAVSLAYQHRNIFRGAEMLHLRLTGATQIINEGVAVSSGQTYRFNSIEYSGEASIDFPKFLIPFSRDRFYKRFHPKTSTGVGYSYQTQPNYTRTIMKGNFGYFWNSSPFVRHTVTPIELNSVRFPLMSPAYLVANRYRLHDFDNFFISSAWYTLTFSNQRLGTSRDYVFLRCNIELAGNVATELMSLAGARKVDGSYAIDSLTKVAQYARAEADLRHYSAVGRRGKLVWRLNAGLGLPYGNIASMPFVKQYLGGGPSDVRAWQAGMLGPGSFWDEAQSIYPNQSANLKLVANAEYRFPLLWMFEGALFADAGNIWSVGAFETRPEARFQPRSLLRQLAVGAGVGVRMDIRFVIIRVDVAAKLKDPRIAAAGGWLPFNQPYRLDDLQWHFGIGYPF